MSNITQSILKHLPFSLYAYSTSMWCICIAELTQSPFGRNSDFHLFDNLVVHAFASCILITFSVDETLLPKYVNLSTKFREPPFSVDISSFLIKTLVLCFVCIHMDANATCCLLQILQESFSVSVYLQEALYHLRARQRWLLLFLV